MKATTSNSGRLAAVPPRHFNAPIFAPPALMGLSPRPLTSINAIRYVANCGGKISGIIPLFDHPKVVVDQERGAARTVGQHQRGIRLAAGQRRRAGGGPARTAPL